VISVNGSRGPLFFFEGWRGKGTSNESCVRRVEWMFSSITCSPIDFFSDAIEVVNECHIRCSVGIKKRGIVGRGSERVGSVIIQKGSENMFLNHSET
jgi:hypothetical protein